MNRIHFSLMVLCLLMTGCGGSKVEQLRKQFVLDKAPNGAMVVSQIRKALQADEAPATMDVVVSGRVYAGADSSPWVEGKAGFILADFTGHDGDSEHDPFGCPYCSESIEDYRVFVTFCDSTGAMIEVDARELFDLNEKQRVTVVGTASLDGEDVSLKGAGIFIEK